MYVNMYYVVDLKSYSCKIKVVKIELVSRNITYVTLFTVFLGYTCTVHYVVYGEAPIVSQNKGK